MRQAVARSPAAAWLLVASMAGVTVAAAVLPWWAAAGIACAAIAAMRTGRWAFLTFAAVSLLLNALLFALLPASAGPPSAQLGPVAFGLQGALVGMAGAARLVAILGANLAVLSWVPAAILLDGLRLPAGVTAFLGAVLIAAHDLGRDAVRLVDAQRLEGTWPHGLGRKARAAARLLPVLAVLALRRAQTRADALRLAGHATGPSFAPLVAVTAMAVAARLALTLAVPNVSLTYVIVFAAGLAFGPRIGALAGLLGMLFTDLLLSGLYLVAFANAPAMALVGVLGGALRGVDFGGRGAAGWAGRMFAAACGLAATVLFSVSADVATWAVVPEFRGTPGSLAVLVLAGLAFNVPAAAVNAVLFAAAVGPVSAAARHAGALTSPALSKGSRGAVPREA